MRSLAMTAILGSTMLFAAANANAQVVISQVYPGGSASGFYLNDYVELLNTGTSAYSLTNHSLQYGTGSSNFGTNASTIYIFPNGTSIAPMHYLLLQSGAAGSGGIAVPSPDLTTSGLEMGPSGGKLALVNITASLNAGATATPLALPDSRVLDLVAYGTSNNAEGGAAASVGVALTSNQVIVRKNQGLQDSNSNINDFDKLTAGGANSPRNASSPPASSAVAEWQLF